MWDIYTIETNHRNLDKEKIKNLLDDVERAVERSSYQYALELLSETRKKIKALGK